MNTDKHNVRVSFIHGNAMSIDLKGCGTLRLEPNKEYFFENAPIKFIDYLAQLKRLGVTYRLTNVKKGCYRTVDLTNYLSGTPASAASKFRNMYKPSNVAPVVTEEVSDEYPDLFPDEDLITTEGNNQEEQINTPTTDKIDTETTDNSTPDESTQASESTKDEEPTAEEPIDINSLSKPKLIEYAHSLGLTQVTDVWTKKEIRMAITELQDNE